MDVPKSKVKLSFKVCVREYHMYQSWTFFYDFDFCRQCFDLVDKDWLSKSDPIVILLEKKSPSDEWTFIGRTEPLKNNLNPSFNEKITLVS